MAKKQLAFGKPFGRNKEEPEIGISPIPGITLGQILRGNLTIFGGISWSPNGQMIASISEDSKILIWDSRKSECIINFAGHKGDVYRISWSPDGSILSSSGEDKTIRFWDINSKQQIRKIQQTKVIMEGPIFSPDGKSVFFGYELLYRFNIETEKYI